MAFERPDPELPTVDLPTAEWSSARSQLQSGAEAHLRSILGHKPNARLSIGEAAKGKSEESNEPAGVIFDKETAALQHTVEIGLGNRSAAAETLYDENQVPPVPPGAFEYRQTLMESSPLPPVTAEAPSTQYTVAETTQNREMSQSELLKLAKSIKIEGVKLKDIYDAKRIDLNGLRAVIETYLRAGDVKQTLTQEIIAREQSFERDPYLRHQRQTANSDSAPKARIGSERSTKLAALSQKKVQKAGHILVSGARQAQHEIIDKTSIVDWLSITAIVIVYSLILFLLLG